MRTQTSMAIVALLLVSAVAIGDDELSSSGGGLLSLANRPEALPLDLEGPAETWLARADEAEARTAARELPARDSIPLPSHTIEGVGGGVIVPTAYLVNPGPEGTMVGLPAASFSYIHLGHKKSIQSFAVTQTFFRRIELGYALARLDLGTLPNAVSKIRGTNIGENEIYLNNFNIRALLIEEDSFNLPLPAITAGVHFKINCGIRSIANHLEPSGLKSIGYQRHAGTDFTLTASKTFTEPLPTPIVLTVGMRNSRAIHTGFGGFANTCETTIETSVACFLAEWLVVAYEYRQKLNQLENPARSGLLGDEDDWHAVSVGILLGEHLSIATGWGCLGNIGNTNASGAWGVQIKYEF